MRIAPRIVISAPVFSDRFEVSEEEGSRDTVNSELRTSKQRPVMRSSLLGLACLVTAALPSLGPSLVAQNNTGTVTGIVVDGVGGVPIQDALVTLVPSGAGPTMDTLPRPAAQPVHSDNSGRFTFTGLGAGRYRISARLEGWLGGQYGQLMPTSPGVEYSFQPGRDAAPIRLRLWRGGSVEGVVMSQGEPAIGVTVHLVKLGFNAGESWSENTLITRADDRGRYRFSNLEPAMYAVIAPFTSFTVPGSVMTVFQLSRSTGDAATRAEWSRRLSYSGAGDTLDWAGYVLSATFRPLVFAYVPRATGLAAFPLASWPVLDGGGRGVQVDVGATLAGWDLDLSPRDTGSISGRLTGPDGPMPFASLRLIDNRLRRLAAAPVFDAARTITDATGRFTMFGVPAGDYTIVLTQSGEVQRGDKFRAITFMDDSGMSTNLIVGDRRTPEERASEQSYLWLEAPVTVTTEKQTAVDMEAKRGVAVRGRVVFSATRQPPTQTQLAQVGVTLRSAPGSLLRQTLAPVDGNGNFVTELVPPGRYFVSVAAPSADWAFRSIVANGHELKYEALVVGDSESVVVEVAFTDRPSSLHGTVTDSARRPRSSTTVVAFPADYEAWITPGMSPRYLKAGATDAAGEFDFSNVMPGEYLVCAIDGATMLDVKDPATIRMLAKRANERVAVAEGRQATTVIVVRQAESPVSSSPQP